MLLCGVVNVLTGLGALKLLDYADDLNLFGKKTETHRTMITGCARY